MILLTKVALLVCFRPFFSPDSRVYEETANQVINNPSVLVHLDLMNGWIQGTAQHMVGYPLLIAASKIIARGDWAYLVCLLQAAFSLFATVIIYRATNSITQHGICGTVVALIYAIGRAMVYDQAILTDSLFSSLFVAFICLQIMGYAKGDHLRARALVMEGCLLAGCLLLRESTYYLLPGLVPLIVIRCWRGSKTWGKSLARSCILLVPFAISVVVYSTWNYERTNCHFLTTGAQTAALWALVQRAEKSPAIFQGGDLVDVAFRATFDSYNYDAVCRINEYLHSRYALSSVDISKLVSAKYLSTWLALPDTMAASTLREMMSGAYQLRIFSPLESIKDLCAAAGRSGFRGMSLTELGGAGYKGRSTGDAVFFVLVAGCRAVSVLVTGLFSLSGPVIMVAALLKRRCQSGHRLLLVGLWLAFFSVIAFFALGHIEPRYIMALTPIPIIGLCISLPYYSCAFSRFRGKPRESVENHP